MSRGPGYFLLRGGLAGADLVINLLPEGLAYGLADLLGAAWYRFAPGRRRLVAANLARATEASGRPARDAALRRLVRDAFIAHARYYLEVVRLPPRRDQISTMVDDADYEELAEILGHGGVVAVAAHYGNFEPAAAWLAAHGHPWVAPMERLEPPALFEYLAARRGMSGGGGQLVVPPGVGRRLLQGLKRGELVAIAADRDVGSQTREVTLFGHPTAVPDGPATLAILTGAPVFVGTLRRTRPGHFATWLERVPWSPSGDRDADIGALTQSITDTMARHVAVAPEQWWAAFQTLWPDLTPESLDR